MTRYFVLSLLLTFVAAVALAAATTVRGTVVAPDGSTPYPDAEITLLRNGATVYTDAQGEFFIRNLEPGPYEIHIKTSRSETKHRITVLPQPVTNVKVAVK